MGPCPIAVLYWRQSIRICMCVLYTYIVTDLLKALLGNGSVNTTTTYVHATIGLPSQGNGEVNTPGIL
jgi:hypothetical protein